MDVERRVCGVSAVCGAVKVNLSMHFPDNYPNSSAPTFVLSRDTSVADNTQSELMKVSVFCALCCCFSVMIWGHL